MTLRCLIDGLMLPAFVGTRDGGVLAYDGNESFVLDALEASYYEVVAATEEEWLAVERAHYRLLRRASDFRWVVRR